MLQLTAGIRKDINAMKKHTAFSAAVMALAMMFGTVSVSAQETAAPAAESETPVDVIYFQRPQYKVLMGNTQTKTNIYVSTMPEIENNNIEMVVADPSIAAISAEGRIIPKRSGTTKVTARYGKLKAETEIKVYSGDYADQVTISTATGRSMAMRTGEKMQLRATLGSELDPSKTSFPDDHVTWSLDTTYSDAAVSIDQNGNVTALRNGTATVVATTEAGFSDQAFIKVGPEIQSLTFDAYVWYEYRPYEQFDLQEHLSYAPAGSEVHDVIWSSSNEAVLKTYGSSLFTIMGPGTARVKATSAAEPRTYAWMDICIYEGEKPTAVRRTTPENVTLYTRTNYGDCNFNIAYSPNEAATETRWTSSDSSILSVSGTGTIPECEIKKTGRVTLTATSVSNPKLSTTFNVSVAAGPISSGQYTTDVRYSPMNPETGKFEKTSVNPSVYEMDKGDFVKLVIDDESDTGVPSSSTRFGMFENSSILSYGCPDGMEPMTDGNHISSMPTLLLYAKAPGEQTFTVGRRTFTIRVNGTPDEDPDPVDPDDPVIHEAHVLSKIFVTPEAGNTFIFADDMYSPAGSRYMTASEYNETQYGPGIGSTGGILYKGTLDDMGARVNSEVVLERGDTYVYRIYLFAKEGFEFAEDTAVRINDFKASRISIKDDMLTADFQIGPFTSGGESEIEKIIFNEKGYTLTPGQDFNLPVRVEPADASNPITWTSSKPNVVKTDGNRLTAMRTGTAVITAKADNGVSASITIRVIFNDVPDTGRYYSDAVYWAVDNGITAGYTDADGFARTFRPENKCTREAVVTFLWRLAGRPEPRSMTSGFTDVQDSSKYYYKAVLWADEQGITAGYPDGTFRPDETCLREHVVTFLWRYAGRPAPAAQTNPFNDVSVSDYYYRPALWASEKGIAKGYSSGEYAGGFGPKLDCLREHVVTFLYRYAK
jgi:uncharacterized protein YjdB